MASFFADLWKLRHVPSIIETHSSNIIMRIRRLVANGTLSPNDVSIAYVCVQEKMPTIRNLDIDAEGNLEKGLPMEFFGADVLDSIKLGAGR
jgi:predicted ATPase